MFLRCGRPTVTLANLALALRMARLTIKKHFCDLDALLFHILSTHLMDIAKAIGNCQWCRARIMKNTPSGEAH
jgi:hypothetical protein